MNGDFRIGPWLVEPTLNRISYDGASRHLEPKVMQVLVYLCKAQGQVVSKQQLIDEVWKDTFVSDDVLTRSISELRDAFGDNARNPQIIQTIPKQGYRLLTAIGETEKTYVQKRRALKLAILAALFSALIATGVHVLRGPSAKTSSRAAGSSLRITPLTHSGSVEAGSAVITPDGKYFFYVKKENGKRSIRMRQIGGLSESTIFTGNGNPLFGLELAGDKLYFAESHEYYMAGIGRIDLYVMPALGGTPHKIVENVQSPAAIAPDGATIAFLRHRSKEGVWDVVVADADGSNERVVYRRSGDAFYTWSSRIAWSPDGRSIALPGRRGVAGGGMKGELAIVDVASKTERLIEAQPWTGGLSDTGWLPDGTGVVIQGVFDGFQQLWLVELPAGTVRRLTHDAVDYTNVSLAADRQSIVSTQTLLGRTVWVADYENPHYPRQVTFSPNAQEGEEGVSWTADGNIVYGSRESGTADIWLLHLQSGNKHRLTEGPARDAKPCASHDGRYIFFQRWDSGGFNLWRMDADGRNPLQLTHSGVDVNPRLSQDDKTVLFSSQRSGKPRLWRIPAVGGEAEMAIDIDARHSFFSSDGRWIGFFSREREPGETVIIDAQSWARIRTVVEKNRAFTPDRKALLFVGNDEGVPNIMVRPLDGRAPYPLTRFRDKEVIDFALSFDGKKLALVLGTEQTDAVLIRGFRDGAEP